MAITLRKRLRREREALRLWAAEQAKIENGTWDERASRNITVAKAFEQYRDYSKVQHRSHNSYIDPSLTLWEPDSTPPWSWPRSKTSPVKRRASSARMRRCAALRSVAERLGHQSMKMTVRYAHLSPAFVSAEVSLLDPPPPPPPPTPNGREKKKRARKGQTASDADRVETKVPDFVQ